jgi:hypothetical protein
MAGVGPRSISINCNVILLSGDEEVPAPWCTVCREMLDLHQPDVDQPNRFLATCGNCGAWHLLEQPEAGGRSFLARLPELPELMRAVRPPAARDPRRKSG